MTKKPKVDQGLCSGCGTCNALCPEYFRLGDDGLSQVMPQESYKAFSVQEAMDSCPVGAISWVEE